ncbi:hypothetical protein CLCR_11224 [Cladophialophora carrionii]|uniref:Uncharacterized protein n=1 Tax=Cladophialophora carrionii TaxID=86049 RepID=A0A1C1C9V3_9EURO|nr:hypothetical protein CLCR_11224 [Cladophialophora carrionii]
MRTANTTSPLMLGNLRQELEEERALLRYRYLEGDQYHVFPSLRRRTRKQKEVSKLLQSTVDRVWQEFRNLECPFLIRNSVRAEEVHRGASDLDEKDRGRPERMKHKLEDVEAGLSSDPQRRYYWTHLAHRFIW